MSTILKSSNFVDPQYLTCLRSYWNGQIETSKKQIVKGISSAKNPGVDLLLYRLWIELAAQERDSTTLNMLKAHLNKLADESEDYKSIYYSLIALVHFELDEIEAAELMINSLDAEKHNLYFCELRFWLTTRDLEQNPDESWLFQFKTIDYVVIEKVARYFATNSAYDRSLGVCHAAEKAYAKSHLDKQIQLQLIMKLGCWKDALEASDFLHKKFPQNPSFLLDAGYASFQLKKYKDAVDYLEMGKGVSYEQDPDILNLLGHSYVELFKQSHKESYFKKASKALETSIDVSREMGLPIEYPSNQKMRLLKMKGHNVEITGRFWLAKLNAQSFAQIRTKGESDVRYLRKPLGGQAQPGDLCFFVYEDKVDRDGRKVWRLGALYKVIEKPEWDPIHRYQNLLSLQFLPEIAVSLDIHEEGRKAGAVHNPEDPRRFDVFEIDQSGFDVIIDNVCEALGEDDQLSRTLTQLRSA
ncbi:tetratricopeptide repeat protein [Pseudobacteriovorax antillogorgiicola]|uniref:Tetratricopeptide repeat-containing protein n=1 Tax=Pseudobacteriovorax antillogorgiicola TaxID=1513793 RepID=A0A1Y6C6N5_9BACT|nr:hypothetical protein [Pseudobacteriovorax antillogorgiicola]TCS49427.1 hypothetical protein EDD56_115108 [Pseudobacteriovorax antillogorgiicola]SMF46751.1 hypothetical protein SAMN06296036_11476 [Pseudobacteriovorax antillogorgiicola]